MGIPVNYEEREGHVTFLHIKGKYGFIQEKDTDISVYFHITDCIEANFEDLRTGMYVNYLYTDTSKGARAIGIKEVNNEN